MEAICKTCHWWVMAPPPPESKQRRLLGQVEEYEDWGECHVKPPGAPPEFRWPRVKHWDFCKGWDERIGSQRMMRE